MDVIKKFRIFVVLTCMVFLVIGSTSPLAETGKELTEKTSKSKGASKIPSSGLVAPGKFLWGICGHPPGGGNIYRDGIGISLKEQLQLIKNGGFQAYRMDVFARDYESTRISEFSKDSDPPPWGGIDELDAIVPAAEEAGVFVYPILYPPHELRPYTTLRERGYTPEMVYDICFRYAKKAASKWCGRIKVWDLLNEPDGWTILPGRHGNTLEDYNPALIEVAAAILKGQSDGIRAGDTDARISLNNGGWLHTGFVDHMIKKGVKFDIIDWHWYNDGGYIDTVRVYETNILEQLLAYGKPVWIGEYNTRPDIKNKENPTSGRPEWLESSVRRIYAYRDKGVEALFIYELLNEVSLPADEPERYYGFFDVESFTGEDGTTRYRLSEPNPSFLKMKELIKELSTRR